MECLGTVRPPGFATQAEFDFERQCWARMWIGSDGIHSDMDRDKRPWEGDDLGEDMEKQPMRYAETSLIGERKIKRALAIFILCAGSANQAMTAVPPDSDAFKEDDEARKKIGQFLPQLQAVEDKYPDDPEIQLGLGILYAKYATSETFTMKAQEQWDKVLKIDPNNKPTLAVSMRRLCQFRTAQRNYVRDWLERTIKSAEKRGAKQVTIYRGSPLYSWFQKEGQETVILSDYDAARKQLYQTLDEQLVPIAQTISRAEKRDPNNALYNYLTSHLYFELGQQEAGLEQITAAVEKQYLNTYFTDTRRAVARVLDLAGFPEHLRSHIENVYAPFGQFIGRRIWKAVLEPLAKSYEDQGDLKTAEELYSVILGIAKHIKEEPLPRRSFLNDTLVEAMETWAHQHIDELHGETSGEEQKVLGQRASRAITYWIILNSCGVLLVGLILVLKKTGASGRK